MSKRGGDNHIPHRPGDPLGNRPKLVVPEGTNRLELSDESKKAIQGLDRAVAQAKFNLGNVEYQISQHYKEREKAIEAIEKAQAAYTAGVLATAKSLGIATDDPSKGKWNFDGVALAFTRTS